MKHDDPSFNRMIISLTILVLIGFVFACVWIYPTSTFFYSGLAADSSGRIYIGERLWIGVYEDGKLVDKLVHNIRGSDYEFTIMDDQIHFWHSPGAVFRRIWDLQGNEVNEVYDEHGSYVLSYREKREFTAEDGRFYELKNGLLKRAKVTCYHPDGNEEIVFRMPIGLYLIKLAFFVYLPAVALWLCRVNGWCRNCKARNKA